MTGDPPIPLPRAAPASRDRPELADVIILVAAVGFGLAWLRMEGERAGSWVFYSLGGGTSTPADSLGGDGVPMNAIMSLARAYSLLDLAVPIMGSIALGLALVQLRRPGLFSGALRERPGLSACLSASVPIVLYLLQRSAARLAMGWPSPGVDARGSSVPGASGMYAYLPGIDGGYSPLGQLAYTAGVAVVATWLVARLGPRPGRRPGAVDPAGRLVGAFWAGSVAALGLLDVLVTLHLAGRI